MGREYERNARGRGFPGSGASDDITASASIDDQLGQGYAEKSVGQTGYYHDLLSDGGGIDPTNDEVVMASVPPGDSYEPSHYATEAGESVSESESELAAAVIEMEGEMRSEVVCGVEWITPDGRRIWVSTVSIDPPQDSGDEFWESVYFYSWTGRDFSQADETEIINTGTYTCEFSTNYGTFREDIEVVGPETTAIAGEVVEQSGEQYVEVDITNSDGRNYAGQVHATWPSSRRSPIGSAEFALGAYESDTVLVPMNDWGEREPIEEGLVDVCVWADTR